MTETYTREQSSNSKKELIYFNPSLEIQEMLADETSSDIQRTLARHTQYPEILRKLYQKNVKIPLNNQHISTDVLDEIYEKEGHMFIVQDALVVHPNTSLKVLEKLSHITHPNRVGEIATLRLSIRKYVEMHPNTSELSFLLMRSI